MTRSGARSIPLSIAIASRIRAGIVATDFRSVVVLYLGALAILGVLASIAGSIGGRDLAATVTPWGAVVVGCLALFVAAPFSTAGDGVAPLFPSVDKSPLEFVDEIDSDLREGPLELAGYAESIFKPRILVVDDELGPRESLKYLLDEHFQVSTTGQGQEAVDLVKQARFDMVLLDLIMPKGLSGVDTLQRIRATQKDLPVIIISGCRSGDFAPALHALGICTHIQKPWNSQQVLGVIRTELAKVHAEM
jgi:CheY-like chemotaxis protein